MTSDFPPKAKDFNKTCLFVLSGTEKTNPTEVGFCNATHTSELFLPYACLPVKPPFGCTDISYAKPLRASNRTTYDESRLYANDTAEERKPDGNNVPYQHAGSL